MNKLEFYFLFRELFRGQQLITDIYYLVQNTFEKTQVSTQFNSLQIIHFSVNHGIARKKLILVNFQARLGRAQIQPDTFQVYIHRNLMEILTKQFNFSNRSKKVIILTFTQNWSKVQLFQASLTLKGLTSHWSNIQNAEYSLYTKKDYFPANLPPALQGSANLMAKA